VAVSKTNRRGQIVTDSATKVSQCSRKRELLVSLDYEITVAKGLIARIPLIALKSFTFSVSKTRLAPHRYTLGSDAMPIASFAG